MKCRLGVYNSNSVLQGYGDYDSIKDARRDWVKYDKPRGGKYAIIEKDDGSHILLGKRR